MLENITSGRLTPTRTTFKTPVKHLQSSSWEKVQWQVEEMKFRLTPVVKYFKKFARCITLPNIAALLVIGTIVGLFYTSRYRQMFRHDFGILPMDNNPEMLNELKISKRSEHNEEAYVAFLNQFNEVETKFNTKIEEMRKDIYSQLDSFREFLEMKSKNSTTLCESFAEYQKQVDDKMSALSRKSDEELEAVRMALSNAEKRVREVIDKSGITIGNAQRHLHNLASRRNGAEVLAKYTSAPFAGNSVSSQFYSMLWSSSTLQWPILDRSYITAGDALCFEGNKGNITIRLSRESSFKSVLYEHDFWTDTMPISAPQEYEIVGCHEEDCSDAIVVAECKYSLDTRSISQYCAVEDSSTALKVRYIQMRILSNYGQDYTCIYSLKVFA